MGGAELRTPSPTPHALRDWLQFTHFTETAKSDLPLSVPAVKVTLPAACNPPPRHRKSKKFFGDASRETLFVAIDDHPDWRSVACTRRETGAGGYVPAQFGGLLRALGHHREAPVRGTTAQHFARTSSERPASKWPSSNASRGPTATGPTARPSGSLGPCDASGRRLDRPELCPASGCLGQRVPQSTSWGDRVRYSMYRASGAPTRPMTAFRWNTWRLQGRWSTGSTAKPSTAPTRPPAGNRMRWSAQRISVRAICAATRSVVSHKCGIWFAKPHG